MKETPSRRITVTSSFDEKTKDQLGKLSAVGAEVGTRYFFHYSMLMVQQIIFCYSTSTNRGFWEFEGSLI